MLGPPNLFRLVSDDPFSYFAEAIRAIKLAADIQGSGRTSNVIGLTSSIPREGKSTIAASLAGQIAQVNNRAILVDCDLRNPALSKSLAPQAEVGILEVVSGRASLDRAILKDPVTGMAFLPAGNSVGVPNTDQILSSDAMKQLFQLLRSRYQYIVVDLSPLAPIVDVRATADFIDSYVFVVEWGVTKIEVVQQTLQEAPRIYENALGVVLNKVDMDAISRYDGERAYHYNAKYYSTHPTD
jgi:succinoglycan biosynthesis transport protein ExoP